MRHKSIVNGFIRAVADSNNPFQTRLSLIITDFAPNGNKQGIPPEEKNNIIRTAQYQPLKINFNGTSFSGHKGAIPIGPIVSVYESNDDGRPVLAGDAVIWNEMYQDVVEHLKTAFSDGIGTSWEIYFEDSVKDENGTEWLKDCYFAGTCIVEVPAYGPNRTRVLAIAEALNEHATTLESLEVTMTKEQTQADSMDETRTELLSVQDVLFQLWEGIDKLYNDTFKIEQAQVEKDIGKIASQFAEKLSKLADKISTMMESAAELESVRAELQTLQTAQAEAEKAQKIQSRKTKLSEAGIEDEQSVQHYIDMPDELFIAVIKDLTSVAAKKTASAESTTRKDVIPEPTGSTSISTNDLVQALKQEFKIRG